MASYVYAVTLKSNIPLQEEDLQEVLDDLPQFDDGVTNVKVLSFDLEDDEYADN